MKRIAIGIAIALSMIELQAAADIPPPEAEACAGKTDGDSCTVGGKSGQCATSTCSRACPTEAGMGTCEYQCVKCTDSSSPGVDAAVPRGTTDSGTGGGASTGDAKTDAGSSTNGGDSSSKSGCSLAHDYAPGGASVAIFGAAIALGIARSRRRSAR